VYSGYRGRRVLEGKEEDFNFETGFRRDWRGGRWASFHTVELLDYGQGRKIKGG